MLRDEIVACRELVSSEAELVSEGASSRKVLLCTVRCQTTVYLKNYNQANGKLRKDTRNSCGNSDEQ